MPETNYLNAKNGIEILFRDGDIQILAGSYDPSYTGLEASIGSIYMCSSTSGTIYKKTGIGNYDWLADHSWSSQSAATLSGFLSLTDTPTTYSGNEGKVLVVGESASIEFIDAPVGYPRYFIEPSVYINVHDWGQYVIHDVAFEVAGTLELGLGSMLILT